MYELTLTHSERQAIDWVGYRYSNGNDLFKLLWDDEVSTTDKNETESIFDFTLWDDNEDITFYLPEHIAWQINENAENEDGFWPCFSSDLATKMQSFCDAIV